MKKRISYLDLLRIVASVFVVFMHTASRALRADVAARSGWFVLAGLSSLAFCAVPLFFMISGFVLTSSDRTRDVRVLVRKRLPRLVVPLFFWSLLYILRGIAATGTFSLRAFGGSLFSVLREPVNVSLWFMYALIGMYLISPLLCAGLRSLDRRGEGFLLGLIAAVKLLSALRIVFPDFGRTYFSFDLVNYLEMFNGNLACFVLGWFLGKTERRFPKPLLWGTALAALGVITAGTILRSSAAGTYEPAFQAQTGGFEILLACSLFLLAKQARLPQRPAVQRVLHELAPCSFAIYLMHNLLLLLTGVSRMTSLAGALLGTGIIYLLALAIAWLCRFVPGLSYLTSGLPRRKSLFDFDKGKSASE